MSWTSPIMKCVLSFARTEGKPGHQQLKGLLDASKELLLSSAKDKFDFFSHANDDDLYADVIENPRYQRALSILRLSICLGYPFITGIYNHENCPKGVAIVFDKEYVVVGSFIPKQDDMRRPQVWGSFGQRFVNKDSVLLFGDTNEMLKAMSFQAEAEQKVIQYNKFWYIPSTKPVQFLPRGCLHSSYSREEAFGEPSDPPSHLGYVSGGSAGLGSGSGDAEFMPPSPSSSRRESYPASSSYSPSPRVSASSGSGSGGAGSGSGSGGAGLGSGSGGAGSGSGSGGAGLGSDSGRPVKRQRVKM